MIRDQELLVSSMSQQGIPAALIRRQFDRLLDEQNKQLQFQNKEDLSHRCSQSSSSYVKTNNSQNSIHCSKKLTENERRAKKLEPSSLLKIRAEKKSIDLQSRNNGLQEPEKAFKIIEKSKTKFTVSCNNVKLNGTQDENETRDLLAAQIHDTSNMCKKQPSANGLENSRNTYHSAATLKSCAEKQNVHRLECHCNIPSQIPSPSHGCADSCPLTKNAMPINLPASQAPAQTYSDNHTQENSIAQNENLSNMTFHPELLEPKIIGGLLYFARKP